MVSKPEWCPEGVWGEAVSAALWAEDLYVEGITESEKTEVVEAIAAAVLKERERCASIARNWPDRIEGCGIEERIMDDARKK